MQPGEEQEIVLAIVWARGADHLASVTALREANDRVQAAFDADRLQPTPPAFERPMQKPVQYAPAHKTAGQPTNLTLRWSPVPGADAYEVQMARNSTFTSGFWHTVVSGNPLLKLDALAPETTYFWRVRSINAAGYGNSSPIYTFSTSTEMLGQGDVLLLDDGTSAFVEVVGPGGSDPCGPDALNTEGCDEVGGNMVYSFHDGNRSSTGAFFMGYNSFSRTLPRGRPEWDLRNYAPQDYEIRFTPKGSYALHAFTTDQVIKVPFEVWDIGPTGPFNENDPADDVQMIPAIGSDQAGECFWGYGEFTWNPFGTEWLGTDRVYAFYPVEGRSYVDWSSAVKSAVENDPAHCPMYAEARPLIDFDRGTPLKNIVFYTATSFPNYLPDAPGEGTVIRFYTTAFGISPPRQSAPNNGRSALGRPVTLWWNAAPDERGRSLLHHLQISTEARFRTIFFEVDSLRQSFYTPDELDGWTDYFWRVRSYHAEGGQPSAWSDVWHFQTARPTPIETLTSEVPGTYQLDQNYPNPFNTDTVIRFGLPRPGAVRLVIYNLLGQQVATLVDGALPAGWHTTRWQPSALGSGVYFYRLETPERHVSRKMLRL